MGCGSFRISPSSGGLQWYPTSTATKKTWAKKRPTLQWPWWSTTPATGGIQTIVRSKQDVIPSAERSEAKGLRFDQRQIKVFYFLAKGKQVSIDARNLRKLKSLRGAIPTTLSAESAGTLESRSRSICLIRQQRSAAPLPRSSTECNKRQYPRARPAGSDSRCWTRIPIVLDELAQTFCGRQRLRDVSRRIW